MENKEWLINTWFKEAVEYHQNGDAEAAESLYKRILEDQPGHVEALFLLGSLDSERGNNEIASLLLKEAVSLRPDHAEAQNNLAVVFLSQGKLEAAVEGFKKAIDLKPDYVEAHFNLAIAFQRQGRLDDAGLSYKQAIALRPDYAEAHYNLGAVFQEQGKFDEALLHYKQALTIKPDLFEAYYNIGNVLYKQARFDEAAASLECALANKLYYGRVYNSLGKVFEKQGKLDKAEENFRHAVDIEPNNADAHFNLGNVLCGQGRLNEAVDSYNQAIAIKPDYTAVYMRLGDVFQKLSRLDRSADSFEKAIALKPDYAEAYYNLGLVRREQGRLDEAVESYSCAIKLKPDYLNARWNRAITWLLMGNYSQGWKEYEVRFLRNNPPPRPFLQPRWDGSLLKGRTILVHAEQGIGDTLCFTRFLPMVKEQGGKVIFECQEGLSHLLRNCKGFDKIVERRVDAKSDEQFEVHAPLLSLPGILGINLNTLPRDIPYIFPDAGLVAEWGDRLKAKRHGNREPGTMNRAEGGRHEQTCLPVSNLINLKTQSLIKGVEHPEAANPESTNFNLFKVGLVWAGNPSKANDSNRSCSLSLFAPLGEVPGVLFFSLQKGAAAAQADNPPDGMPIINLEKELNNFSDTAAVIANLDLVISVDTAVAHLAGALGKPIWTILPFSPDWRWLLGRDDSPWYPTMRLFRQPEPGYWISVMRRVAEELKKLLKC